MHCMVLAERVVKMSFKVYDYSGNERDMNWVHSEFGDVQIHGDTGALVSELRARTGDSALVVKVLNSEGLPMSNVKVAFYWPDAPQDPNAGWYNRCVTGTTNAEGCVGFGMGEGAYYWPPAGGPHAVWVYGSDASQVVTGLGMKGGTNHNHLNVVFSYEDEEPPIPPPPSGDCPKEEILDVVSRMEMKLITFENDLAEIRSLLEV